MNTSTVNQDYDVMIVGGGPAGISTWLHLHKYAPELASRTILIEKAKYPRDKLCGGAVGGWSDVVLSQLNVNIDVPSVWVDDVECRFGNDVYHLNESRFFRVVQRREFDHELAKTAIKRGLHLNEGEMFLDFVRIKDYLDVKTNLSKYKVKTLVGADGALSKVRKKMSLQNKPNLAPAIEIFAPVNPNFDPEFEEKKVVFDFSPIKEGLQGYIWHFPCLQDDQPSMNHGIGDFRINKNYPTGDMKTIFRQELEKRNIRRETKSWSSYPIHWYSEDDILSRPNVLLVGDAAGIDPATGGGIHLALSYGELATQAIISAFKDNDFTYENFKQRFQIHLVGKYIQKLTSLAIEMYNQKTNPLDAVQKIFSKR